MSVNYLKGHWYYRFMVKGASYHGACKGATNRKEAEDYEASVRKEYDNVRSQKSVVAMLENYRYELTGGHPIRISEAYDEAMKRPSRRKVSAYYAGAKKLYWADFAGYMAEYHPEIETIAQLRKTHCEDYVCFLINNGRYIGICKRRAGRGSKQYEYTQDIRKPLSTKTIHEIITVCHWVVGRIEEEAGVVRNPFSGVETPIVETTDRQIFTEAELALIKEGLKTNTFCRPLFFIAALTGLTEGDICTLKWNEISWTTNTIYHTRRKTKVKMEIPIAEPLREYLLGIPETDEYIFPTHAHMYLESQGKVSSRVKSFLNGLGIVTTVDPGNGRRAISVKDLHSMRHVFCYYAGQAGIPLGTVQSIVGHMSPEMTRHYMRHESTAVKNEAIKKLPDFLILSA